MEIYDEVRAVKLSDGYQKQIRLFNYWGHVGKKLWEPLKLITVNFEVKEAEIPDHTVPPSALPLRGIEANLLIQIAYMRAIATEMMARDEHKAAVAALDPQEPETKAAVSAAWSKVTNTMTDYARVYTLTFMSDRQIAKEAMERSMAILKDDPNIKDNYTMQKEAYAMASFYKDLFGGGKVPAGCEEFLKEPVPPEETPDPEAVEEEKEAKPKADPKKAAE